MLRDKRIYFWSLLLFCFLGLLIVNSWPEFITLRAGQSLVLLSNPNRPLVAGTLANGEEVYVVECMDMKSDLVIKVQTKRGEIGYVSGGDFRLFRKNASLYNIIFNFDLVTSSCRGMYGHRG